MHKNSIEISIYLIASFILFIIINALYLAVERISIGTPAGIVSILSTYAENEKHEFKSEVVTQDGLNQIVVNAGDIIYVEYDIFRNRTGKNIIHRYIDSCDGAAILIATDIRYLTKDNLGRKKVIYAYTVPKFNCTGPIMVRTYVIFDKPLNPFFILFPVILNTIPATFYYK